MESQSDRVLRKRTKVEYFPKQPLFNMVAVEAGSRRRSKSVDVPRPAARRVNRSQSVDQPRMLAVAARRDNRTQSIERTRMAARRAVRSKSVDERHRNEIIPDDAVTCLAQSISKLTATLTEMKGELVEKNNKIDMLVKQDKANQQLIRNMIKEGEEKQKEMANMEQRMQHAFNRLGKQDTHIFHETRVQIKLG